MLESAVEEGEAVECWSTELRRELVAGDWRVGERVPLLGPSPWSLSLVSSVVGGSVEGVVGGAVGVESAVGSWWSPVECGRRH